MSSVLLIENQEGQLVTVAVMNQKGFSKSIEKGYLWTIDLSTGRLLPFENQQVEFVNLSKERSCIGKDYYKAVICAEVMNKLSTIYRKKNQEEAEENPKKISENTLNIVDFDKNINKNDLKDKNLEFPVEFLPILEQVIHKRHLEMPEGSYTTHLFQKGESKIRKKLGEEAVELLLAQTPTDVIYEAADLIYHLMVMLENNGLSFGDVIRELKGRDS